MTIRQGTHSPFRLPSVVTEYEIAHRVMFTPSCRYDIGPEQSDVNKLFGVGYAPHHHRNSVRFGWRYDRQSDMIEILAYWYLDGQRYIHPMMFAGIGQTLHYAIRRNADHHLLIARWQTFSVPVHSQRVGYLLRPYFGGNMTAPHDITINMTRL